MTADWESVRETEEDRRDRRLSDVDVRSTRAYSRATDALSYSKGALQHCRETKDGLQALSKEIEEVRDWAVRDDAMCGELEAEMHGLRARIKYLEDLVDIADRTAMWGCLLAAVSAGLAVGALIVAIIAEAMR